MVLDIPEPFLHNIRMESTSIRDSQDVRVNRSHSSLDVDASLWICHTIRMESINTLMETPMSDPFNDTLSHSGKMMLSGMNVKPSAVTQAEIDAFLAKGGEIKQIKSKAVRKHSPRSKSHQMGGKHSRYNMGGRNSKKSRSAYYVKHA